MDLHFPGFHLEDKVAVWAPDIVTTPAQGISNIITCARIRMNWYKGFRSKRFGAEE